MKHGWNLLMIILIVMMMNACNSQLGELQTETIAIKLSKEYQDGGYQLVSTSELLQWINEGQELVIVDTMPYEASYLKSHIVGATHFEFPIEPLYNLSPEGRMAYEKVLGEDKSQKIVVYCGFTKCGRSHNGAKWARELGYQNVYRYPGGIVAWQEANNPVSGEKEAESGNCCEVN